MINFENGLLDAAKKALEIRRQKEIKIGRPTIHPDNRDASLLLENSVREHENLAMEKEKREQVRMEFIALARELSEIQKSLPFHGIDPEGYLKLKAVDEEFPGFATPIDELSVRLRKDGIKVVFGKDPLGSNVFISPFEMDDDAYDGIQPEYLKIDENMDKRLRKLILLRRVFLRKN